MARIADTADYVPPTPIALPRANPMRLAARRLETGAVFARHLGPAVSRRALRRRSTAAEVGKRLRRVFDDLGSTYVKFGQLIASSPAAFGPEIAEAFRSLLDGGAPVPFPAVRATIEAEFGGTVDDLFATFDTEPIAAASMAVVHKATLPDGTPVAVKVLRPGMDEDVAVDLAIMQPLFRRLGLMGVGVGGVLYRYISGFRRQVSEELDLRNEARTMVHFRNLIAEAGLTTITVPEPVDELVSQRVLVMEFLDGVPIDDLAAIGETGVDPRPLVRGLLDFWFLTGLRDGVFHGDIHAGNLMLLRDGRLGLIDWGIVGVLDDEARFVFRRFVAGVLGDAAAWADVAAFMQKMMPFIQPDESRFAAAKDEIGGVFTKPFGEVNFRNALGDRAKTDRAERRERLTRMNRVQRESLRAGVADSDFGQANFLLFKQLLYFDRYGKLYLGDEALLGDQPYLKELLAEP